MVKLPLMQRLTLRLVDGKPDGMLEVEESNWAGHVLLTPRDHIRTKKLHDRPEARRAGVYILLGEKMGKPTAYVGESNKIIERLGQHVTKKDWWEEAILVTKRAGEINKAHAQYLEARLYEIIKDAGRVNLENDQNPSSQNLSGDDKHDMDKFLDALLIILPTVRGNMFLKRPSRQEDEKKPVAEDSTSLTSPVFLLRGGQDNARMVLDDSDYIVLKGSYARRERKSKDRSAVEEIKELEDKGILKSIDSKRLQFTEDYAFKSASKAARVIVGYNVNGLDVWRVKDTSQTLKEWETEQLGNGKVPTKEDTNTTHEIFKNQDESHHSDTERKKPRPPFTFSMVNIPIGSEITFRRDKSKTAKVAGNGNEIEYKGKTGSISTITQEILNNELGMNWSSAQGAGNWLYKGEILTKRRERLENTKQNNANPVDMTDAANQSLDEFEKTPEPKSGERDLRFTEILEATVNGEIIKKPSWRNIVAYILTLAGKNKHNLNQIREIFPGVLVKRGKHSGYFKYIPEIDCSIHDQDASNIANAIEHAASMLGFKVYIKFRWKETPKASRPGETDSIRV